MPKSEGLGNSACGRTWKEASEAGTLWDRDVGKAGDGVGKPVGLSLGGPRSCGL
jgi:hypothetical protein